MSSGRGEQSTTGSDRGHVVCGGRSSRLKFGPAVSVLPGRNPVLMAKMLASLDVISGGRCLPAFGLGIANTAEHQAFGVERMQRAPWLNEAMPLMRRLWSEDEGHRAASHRRIVEMLDEYIDVGASKFVLFPFTEPIDWHTEIEALAQAALPLQT